MEDKISIGDFVNVYFEHAQCLFDCKILYIPCATGDSFYLKSSNGKIYAVQNYAYMEKIDAEAIKEEE